MKRTVLTILIWALVSSLAQAQSSGSLGFAAEDLPAAPQLETSPAWLAEEYSRKFESHAYILRSQPLDLGNWKSLTTLKKKTKIRVVDGNFKKTKGRFIEASDRQLKFKANGKVRTLDRDNIRMVSLRLGPSTGERILMGLLAGAVIGAVTYAEASLCEKHGCQDERTGEWYEGSGKSLSARSGYIAAGVGAAGLGILAAFAETEDVVIYFQQPKADLVEVSSESSLVPFEAGQPEGGNVFAPAKEGEDTRETKEDNVRQ